jgi:hypothetical protein
VAILEREEASVAVIAKVAGISRQRVVADFASAQSQAVPLREPSDLQPFPWL